MATSASAGLFRVLLWQSKGAMMPAERVAMRHVREIIRLKFSAGISTREIARRLGIAASTVRETLRRFEGAGLGSLAGRHERRRPGGGALRQSRDQTGPSPPRRAGLADGSSGAEARARHPGDRLG